MPRSLKNTISSSKSFSKDGTLSGSITYPSITSLSLGDLVNSMIWVNEVDAFSVNLKPLSIKYLIISMISYRTIKLSFSPLGVYHIGSSILVIVLPGISAIITESTSW